MGSCGWQYPKNFDERFFTRFFNIFENNVQVAYILVFGILEKLLIVLKTDISTYLLGLLLALACSANTVSLKTKQSNGSTSVSSIHFLQQLALKTHV